MFSYLLNNIPCILEWVVGSTQKTLQFHTDTGIWKRAVFHCAEQKLPCGTSCQLRELPRWSQCFWILQRQPDGGLCSTVVHLLKQFYIFFQTTFKILKVSSVAQSCLTLCDPMDYSTPGFPVHHQLLEPPQTHVHRIGDAIHILIFKNI